MSHRVIGKVTFMVMVSMDVARSLVRECLSPKWRRRYYDLVDDADVLRYLAFNIAQGRSLRDLDGHRHRKFTDISFSSFWDNPEVTIEHAVESSRIRQPPKRQGSPSKRPSRRRSTPGA
jgi:hypothetical protein